MDAERLDDFLRENPDVTMVGIVDGDNLTWERWYVGEDGNNQKPTATVIGAHYEGEDLRRGAIEASKREDDVLYAMESGNWNGLGPGFTYEKRQSPIVSAVSKRKEMEKDRSMPRSRTAPITQIGYETFLDLEQRIEEKSDEEE